MSWLPPASIRGVDGRRRRADCRCDDCGRPQVDSRAASAAHRTIRCENADRAQRRDFAAGPICVDQASDRTDRTRRSSLHASRSRNRVTIIEHSRIPPAAGRRAVRVRRLNVIAALRDDGNAIAEQLRRRYRASGSRRSACDSSPSSTLLLRLSLVTQLAHVRSALRAAEREGLAEAVGQLRLDRGSDPFR